MKYTGAAQALVTAGSDVTGGTLQYKLDSGNYSTDIPAATNAGDYTVKYKVVATDTANYSDSAEVTLDTITIGKETGAQIDASATKNAVTHNSITINAATVQSPNTGAQTAEYAINQSSTDAPTSDYQTGLTFTDLDPNTEYYVWARTKGNANYSAGTAKVSDAIKTNPVIAPPGSTVEVDEDGNVEVTLPDDGGTVIVPPGSTVEEGDGGNIDVTLPGEDEPIVIPPGTKIDEDKNVTYKVLEHFGTYAGSGDASATIDADHNNFVRLKYGSDVVDKEGNYTVTSGSTIITLTEDYLKTFDNGTHTFVAEFQNGVTASLSLVIQNASAKVQSVTITGAPAKFAYKAVGAKTLQLRANVLPANAANKNVTWKSSNPKIAAVNAAGLVTFTGVEGDVIITATATDGSEKFAAVIIKSAPIFDVTFKNHNGKVLNTQEVEYGEKATAPKKPTRKGYKFAGWYTSKKGGAKTKFDTKITANTTLYSHWTANKYTVKFKADGGKVSKKSKKITFAKKYGALPKATKKNKTFAGWYTKKSGGTKITSASKVKNAKSIMLYAHWKNQKVEIKIKNCYYVWVHSGPGNSARKISVFKKDATVEIIAQFGGWYKVKSVKSTTKGWVYGRFIGK